MEVNVTFEVGGRKVLVPSKAMRGILQVPVDFGRESELQ